MKTPFWIPAAVSALLWVVLAGLVQPWVSRTGILLYTDAALLLVPARYLPRRAAVLAVLFGALCADALRASTPTFGLSASLLLPVLLLLHPFQQQLREWSRLGWLACIVGINAVLWTVHSLVWTFNMPAKPSADVLWSATLAGAVASSVFIFLFGFWFISFQISLFAWLGTDLQADPRNTSRT
jgi:hypothetical protein